MKKQIFLFVFFLYFTNYIFAQKVKISEQQAIEKIKTFHCDCSNTAFKDFSLKFHKILDKMAKEIRTTSKLTITPMQKYLEKNKAELTKFEKITGKNNEDCEFDFEDELDMNEDEFAKFFAKNINEIIALMKKDEKCNKGFVMFNLYALKLTGKL